MSAAKKDKDAVIVRDRRTRGVFPASINAGFKGLENSVFAV